MPYTGPILKRFAWFLSVKEASGKLLMHWLQEIVIIRAQLWYKVFLRNVSQAINALRPGDAIWRQWSRTTLTQVMTWCLTAPSHYLNQCWLIIRGVLWHSSENSFAGIALGINSGYEIEKDILKIIFKSPRGLNWQRVSQHWFRLALVQIKTWRRTGDKPLSEPMVTFFHWRLIHWHATRPHLVKLN